MIKVYIQSSHLKVFYNEASDEEKLKSETILKTKFSAKDSSMKMNPLVKKGILSDIRSFYNEEYNILPSGFWKFLQHYYDSTNIQYEVVDMRRFPKVDKQFLKQLMKNEIEIGGEKPRDYQIEAVMTLIQEKGGICSLSTGAGKTLIMSLLLKAYSKANFIVLFNTIDLIEQSYREMIKYGFTPDEVGVIQGSNRDQNKRITLLSVQSYENAFGIFPRIHGIIADEVHETGRTNVAEKIIYSCQNCSLKIGLSATPWNDNDFQTMRLYGNIGPIIYKKEIKEQIEQNYLTPTNVMIFMYECEPVIIKGNWSDRYDMQKVNSTKHENNLKANGYEIVEIDGAYYGRKFLEYGDEYTHFVNNETRNALIIQLIKDQVKEGRRILVMFNRIEHGEILKSMYPNAILIHGEHDLDERRYAEQQLTEKPGTVVLVSKIWAQGKNIPLVDCLINASGGHASTKVAQKLGRVVRKAKDKDNALVIDFDDECISIIGKRQSEKRINIYRKKLGLPVEFVKRA